MAFGIFNCTGGCGGAIGKDYLCGKEKAQIGSNPVLGLVTVDIVAVIAMGIIVGLAAGGALHLSPAAAYGMAGAIVAIPLFDFGSVIFFNAVGKDFTCLKNRLTCLREPVYEEV